MAIESFNEIEEAIITKAVDRVLNIQALPSQLYREIAQGHVPEAKQSGVYTADGYRAFYRAGDPLDSDRPLAP